MLVRHCNQVVDQEVGAVCADVIRQRGDRGDTAGVAVCAGVRGSVPGNYRMGIGVGVIHAESTDVVDIADLEAGDGNGSRSYLGVLFDLEVHQGGNMVEYQGYGCCCECCRRTGLSYFLFVGYEDIVVVAGEGDGATGELSRLSVGRSNLAGWGSGVERILGCIGIPEAEVLVCPVRAVEGNDIAIEYGRVR